MKLQDTMHDVLDTATRAELENTQGVIFDIQRFSLHDGPGLRTNVFFKGCSLCCAWCCNPESQLPTPELSVFAANCLACGECLDLCPKGALHLEGGLLLRDETRCNHCGLCVPACPAGALRMIGRRVTAGEVLREALRDMPFYGSGAGGLTLTGGEPTCQIGFALALLRLAKDECLHTTLETCGQTSWKALKSLVPYVDLILYDIKHMTPQKHRLATGIGNKHILENVKRLVAAGANVVLRIPLIPGFNADEDNLRRVAAFASSVGIEEIHLLPYHALGRPKYHALGRNYSLDEITPMKDEQAEAMAEIIRAYGLRVLVGG